MICAAAHAVWKIRIEHWPLVWLWPISLVFMQLTLVDLDGFQLTLAVLICHAMQIYVLMLYWIRTPSDGQACSRWA